MFSQIIPLLQQIKKQHPLVVNITNFVTMAWVANGLLSVGASPVMIVAENEIMEILQHAAVLIINIGTLDENFLSLAHTACRGANVLQIPVVLDPAGAGASRLRTVAARDLLETHRIAILRGNASEVMALAGSPVITHGVDSHEMPEKACESASTLALRHEMAVFVSGACDIIVDKDQRKTVCGGSPLLRQLTGAGCLLSALVGAFHALEKSAFSACVTAAIFYGECARTAAQAAAGPGSFSIKLLDCLSRFPEEGEYNAETVCTDNCWI